MSLSITYTSCLLIGNQSLLAKTQKWLHQMARWWKSTVLQIKLLQKATQQVRCTSFTAGLRMLICWLLSDTPDSKPDPAVDEVNELFKGLNKKKKSSKKPKEETTNGNDEPTPAADGEFDPTALKKKKKKKVPKADTDEFEAKLAEAGVNENGETLSTEAAQTEEEISGDMIQGTGIWAHDAEKAIKYEKLLERFFANLNSAHPDILSSGQRTYTIPPPQCLREGNKKTIFANLPELCKRMKRGEEHVMQFVFAELGTSGSVDGSRRLVIKGRFQQKQIENVLRRYVGQ